MVLTVRVGSGGSGSGVANRLVEVGFFFGSLKSLSQLVFVNPAIGPSDGGRGFGNSIRTRLKVWLHPVESSGWI